MSSNCLFSSSERFGSKILRLLVVVSHPFVMLGIQIRKKWKPSFHVDHFFRLQIFFMQISGQWNVNYGKVLPRSLEFLSRYINIFYMVFINFCNLHMAVLFAINFFIDFFSGEVISVTKQSDEIMSIILYSYGVFGSVYIQINQKKFTKLMYKINDQFHMRSAAGKRLLTELLYITRSDKWSYLLS